MGEECLTAFGLSSDCETTKRSEELKTRLRSHLYPEVNVTNNVQSLQFLKYGAVLKRIPKGSHLKAGKVLTQILDNLVQKNDIPFGKNVLYRSIFSELYA